MTNLLLSMLLSLVLIPAGQKKNQESALPLCGALIVAENASVIVDNLYKVKITNYTTGVTSEFTPTLSVWQSSVLSSGYNLCNARIEVIFYTEIPSGSYLKLFKDGQQLKCQSGHFGTNTVVFDNVAIDNCVTFLIQTTDSPC